MTTDEKIIKLNEVLKNLHTLLETLYTDLFTIEIIINNYRSDYHNTLYRTDTPDAFTALSKIATILNIDLTTRNTQEKIK